MEESPDSRKRVRVGCGEHSVIAASSERRHELASRSESMKSGFGTGILILRPVFPFPFSLEVTSSDTRKRSEDGGEMNDDDMP